MVTYLLPGAEIQRRFLSQTSSLSVGIEDLDDLTLQAVAVADYRLEEKFLVECLVAPQPTLEDRAQAELAIDHLLHDITEQLDDLRELVGAGGQIHFDRWLPNGDIAVALHANL